MSTSCKYHVVYCGIFHILDPDERLDVTDGFNSHDYLDGWDEVEFKNATGALGWIILNHRGPDRDGYTARFTVARGDQT